MGIQCSKPRGSKQDELEYDDVCTGPSERNIHKYVTSRVCHLKKKGVDIHTLTLSHPPSVL